MKPSPVLRLLAAAASLALGLLVLGTAPPAHAADHHVVMSGYAFGPAALTVAAGDAVTWTNRDTAPHDVTVTSGPQTFHSPLLSKGDSWTFTFRQAGTYSYICSVHPDMRASITVQAAPTRAAAPASAASAASTSSTSSMSSMSASAGTPAAASGVRPPAQGAGQARHHAAGPQPATSAASDATAAQGGPSMSPLVLVAGAAAAVIVFSLLLMAARPMGASEEATTG